MRKPLILPLTEAWPSENCEILEPWNYISLKSLPVSTTSRRNARRIFIQKSVDAIVAKATRVYRQILAHTSEAETRTSTSTFRSPAETKDCIHCVTSISMFSTAYVYLIVSRGVQDSQGHQEF
jgi:hypothetical protein